MLCELVLPIEEIEAKVRRAWSDVAAGPDKVVSDQCELVSGLAGAPDLSRRRDPATRPERRRGSACRQGGWKGSGPS
jgi:hypothetical protein